MDEEQQLFVKEFQPNLQEQIGESLHGDSELIVFFHEWIKCEMNATKAYLVLRPSVSEASARVLASRKMQKLAKVNIWAILGAYGLGIDSFLQQVRQGLSAVRINEQGKEEADLKTRSLYLQLQAKLLRLF